MLTPALPVTHQLAAHEPALAVIPAYRRPDHSAGSNAPDTGHRLGQCA